MKHDDINHDEEIKKAFTEIDTDKDGKILMSELWARLERAMAEEGFDKETAN